MGVNVARADAYRSQIGKLAVEAQCLEYSYGPVLLFASFIISHEEWSTFETASNALASSFFVVASLLVLGNPESTRLTRVRRLVIESSAVGDVLADYWDIWISGPFDLTFRANSSSTGPCVLP